MLKRIFKFIITAGLTQNQYESIRTSLSRKNYRTLRAFSTIATFFFTLAFLVALITGIDSMMTKIFAYGTSAIFSAITLGLTLWLGKKHYKFLSVLQFTFIVQLLLFGLCISLIINPEQLTISLLAFYMITPHIFISKPINTLLPIITSIILFLVFAPQVKPSGILPLEIVDCLTYGTLGLVTGFYSTRSKLRALLFEKQIIELNNNEHLTSYLKSISNIYVSMTYLDLESRAFIQLKSHKFVSDYIKKVSEDFDRHIVIAMKETTQAEYLEDILKFVDPNTLAERIKGKSKITHEFLGKNYGWCRARFIAVGNITEDYVPRYVIFAVEDINEQKSREKTLIIKAETDAMTGILNRQAGIDKIQQSLKEKKKGMFCLFDVDKFKKSTIPSGIKSATRLSKPLQIP